MAVFEMRNARKAFGLLEVLKGVSLKVEKGEVVAIIGPSGGGKSTMLRCATLLETMDSGTLAYGENVAAREENGKSVYAGKAALAQVLGYTKAQTFFKIILPQMVKRVIPAVTNEVITLVKDTSLASVIGTVEMFTRAKQIVASPNTPGMLALVAAGVFYYVFNYVVAFAMEKWEQALRYYR